MSQASAPSHGWRIPHHLGVLGPNTDVERPVSAIEVEPVIAGVLDHPLGDIVRANAREPHIDGKTETGAVRPAIATEFAPGVLVQGSRGIGFWLQVDQFVQGRRGKGVGEFWETEPIDDRVEHQPAKLTHRCVGL